MSCVISAPATDNGKTTLSLLINCWAFSKGLKMQTFKVGPDYLDQQQLSSIGQPICRNLDIFLSGEDWIKKTFNKYSHESDLSLIEGAMGLFEGLGSTDYSSTANVAKVLDIPIIFIIDARGKVASLLPLLRGFRDFDRRISIKGVVFNNVNSQRHKSLIEEVFKEELIDLLGFLPFCKKISLAHANLGLVSPSDSGKKIDVEYFSSFAEKHLNLIKLMKYLKSPENNLNKTHISNITKVKTDFPIAIAEDKIFHFQYPETKEYLHEIGIPLLSWDISKDEEIPKEARALIIPGGFPEKYARQISSSKRSLDSIKNFYKKGFIYAECGGMMMLGESIEDTNGDIFKMAGILPFKSKKGPLKVGYRFIKGEKDSILIKKNQEMKGHEFHYWEIERELNISKSKKENFKNSLYSPWKIKSWNTSYKKEGWSNKNLHASWIHLHLPSNEEAIRNILEII